MSERKKFNSTRRNLFLGGSAAIGSLATAAAGANVLFNNDLSLREQMARLREDLAALEDADALRQLQLAYTGLLQRQAYAEVPWLFTDDAVVEISGHRYEGSSRGINDLFARDYAHGKAHEIHTAFRLDQAREHDSLEISDDGLAATALMHCQVQISRPLSGDTALEIMAREAGQHASSRWQAGAYAMDFQKRDGQWKISRLTYLARDLYA